MKREPKKTESLELRLPMETKSAFMSACRANGASASGILRACIDRYLRTEPRAPVSRKGLRMLFTGRSWPGRAAAGFVTILGAGIATLTLVGPAVAASDPRLAALFEWVDADHDQRISASEFEAMMSDETPQAPLLGAISVTVEWNVPAAASQSRPSLFSSLDVDHDANVSLDELSQGTTVRTVASAAIAGADANADGRLSEGELAAYFATLNAVNGKRDGTRGAALLARGIIAEHDRNKDGTVLLADLKP